MSEITEVPELSPTAELSEIRQAVQQLIQNGRAREPNSVGDPAQKFLTTQIAADLGLVAIGGGGTIIIGGPGTGGGGTDPPDPGDLSPPDPITGLEADAALANFFVEFDAPTYSQGGGNGYTEVYGANYGGTGPLPTFSNAVLVGTIAGAGSIGTFGAEPGQTTHFWVGAVTANGVRQVDSTGPTGGTHGVAATTAVDPSHLLEVLTGQITESQLYTDLAERIDLIDGPATMPGSVAARVKVETDARVSADEAIAESVTELTAQFVASGRNLAPNSSFENDLDDNGVADDWAVSQAGTVGTINRTLVAGRQVGLAQRIGAPTLGDGDGDRMGVVCSIDVTPGSLTASGIMVSGYMRASPGVSGKIVLGRYTAGAFVNSFSVEAVGSSTWQRISVAGGVASTIDEIRVNVFACKATVPGAVWIEWDDILIQPGQVLNSYEPGVGDIQTSQAAIKAVQTASASATEAVATSVETLTAQFTASGKNMVLNSSFELDSDEDGLADSWLANTLGTATGVVRSRVAGRVSGFAARSAAVTHGNSTNDRHGFEARFGITPGGTPEIMTSVWARGTNGCKARILVDRYTAGAINGTNNADFAMDGTWQRIFRQVPVAITVDEVRLKITLVENDTGTPATWVEFDDAMVQPGTLLTEYTPGAGDFQQSFAAVRNEASARATADEAIATNVSLVQAQMLAIGTNMLRNSSFERDTDGNGTADAWTLGSGNTTGSITRALVAGRNGGFAQRSTAAGLGTDDGDYHHFTQDVDIDPAGGAKRTLSAWMRGTAGADLYVAVSQYQGATFLASSAAEVVGSLTWQRPRITFTLNPLADMLRVVLRQRDRATAAGEAFFDVDDAQLEDGDVMTAYSPGPGETQGLYAAVQTEALARASADGQLFGSYTVKVDVAGLVSGYGLASTANNGTPTSAFGVRASSFWVAPPSTASSTAPTVNLYDGFVWLDTSVTPNVTRYWRSSSSTWVTTSPALPFIIQTTPTTINGEVVPPGVYMSNAYMARLVATRGQIGLLAVDDARIANLSVGKLVAGSLAVGEYVQSTGFVSGSQGFRISGNGAAEFSGVTVRGLIYASGGTIGGAVIDTSGVRSANYVLNTSGWRLDNATGQMFANEGRIGGAVIDETGIQSANYAINTAGWRMDNATGQIRAYSGVLGQWTLDQVSLRMGKTDYGVGTGLWLGRKDGTPMVDFGSPTNFMRWNGTTLLLSNPTLELDTFSASINAGDSTVTVPGDSQNFKLVNLGSRSVSGVSGGRAPYTYQWFAVAQAASSAASSDYSVSGGTTSSCTLYAYGTGETHQKVFRLICLVTDANGRQTSVGATITANLTAIDSGE